MKKVLKYIKPYILVIIVAVVLVFIQCMSNLYLPTLMSDIINNGIVGKDMDAVFEYGTKMLIVTLISMVCSIGASFIASKVSSSYARDLRKAVYTKVQSYSLNEFKKIGTSSLITRNTNDITQVQTLTLMIIRMMSMAPMMCIGGIIMALSKNLQLSIIFVVAIPLLLLIIIIAALKIVPLFTKIQEGTDKLNQIIREKLTGVRVIRAFSKEKYEKERFDTASKNMYNLSLKAGYIISLLMPIIFFMINVSTIAITWFGSNLIADGSLQIGDMMAFVQYAMQVLFSLLMVTMLFIMIPRSIVSAKRINEVLSLESELIDNEKEVNKTKQGEIELNNVSFMYEDGSVNVLSDISFKVNKGETVAIIGATGSGKTTLLNLLLRFYDITSGSISIGGQDIKDIGINNLRDMIGFVPQKANLFSGTIKENLLFGKQDATDEEIVKALKTAQSYDFVTNLEDGINHLVSQGGTNFSGGQKQRLSIARAIIKQPDIYIFDDSFSALDYSTDKNLRLALKEQAKDSTVIIVAQRVSTILTADKIIFIDDGKIICQGSHHELFETSKEYKDLVLSQITLEEATASGK